MSLRIAFFGTPEFAVPTLDALLASPHRVVTVVTQPDRPRGRGQKLSACPVKARALDAAIPVLQPDRLRDTAFVEAFSAAGADLGVVAAYGKILPQTLLDRPRLGMINVHASLLPRWRGAAPIHRAIMAGDGESGVTIMRVVQALDAGPMLARVVRPIGPDTTSPELEADLAVAGAALLRDVVDRLALGPVAEQAQDEAGVTYAQRLERAESGLDWSLPARTIHDRIRGLQPWPMVSTVWQDALVRLVQSRLTDESAGGAGPGTVLAVDGEGLLVATGDGAVRLLRVQPQGRAAMAARDFANGRHLEPGTRFMPVTTS